MTTSDTYNYLIQLTAESVYRQRDPRYPTLHELYDFIKKYEEVTLEELKQHLNALYKEGKIKVNQTINNQLVELV